MESLSSHAFRLFQTYIEEHCGIRILDDKEYLIESRLSRFLIQFGLTNFDELYCLISQQQQPDLAEAIIDAITTNETQWFRDKTPWQFMEEVLLPKYTEKLQKGECSTIRIWCAACATGQEPYSIAMCIDRYLKRHSIEGVSLADFEIVATDISHTVLKLAQLGKYDSISMSRGLDITYRDSYFQQAGRIWTLDPKIKEAVKFRQFNLQNRFSSLGRFDLIFLRYVTIYFSDAFKTEIIEKTARALHPKGYLVLGNSEVFLDYTKFYEAELFNNINFYRLRGGNCENTIGR